MGTSADSSGIGKPPDEVDEAQPDPEAFEAYLEQNTEEAGGESEASGGDPAGDLPSRAELWQVVQDQQDQIESQQEQIDQMQQRIDHLEGKVDDVEFEASTVEEVADQLQAGKIGGEAGAAFIRDFVEVPESDSVLNARSIQLFFHIIEEHRVDTPFTSSEVVDLFDLGDSANPSVQAKRIMERLVEHREAGFFLGEIELKKHRGKNSIWLGN